MTRSPSPRFAPGPSLVLVICALFAVATPVLTTVVSDHRVGVVTGVAAGALLAALLLTWSIVGALVASRLPRNPLGWLFLAVGALFTVGPFLELYASSTRDGTPLPARQYAAWGANLLLQNPATFGILALIILLYPTGRAMTARWRRLAVAVSWSVVVYTAVLAVKPGNMAESRPPTDNPFGLATVDPLWSVVDSVFGIAFVVAAVCGLVSIALRFRAAAGVERQQMKWLAAGAAGLVLVVLSGPAFFWRMEDTDAAWQLAFVSGLTLLPVTAGVAILRYRLFDIERIISRTVSYLVVAGLLVASYVGLALTLQAVASPVLGGGDLPVALSTLAAAAAFRPLHRRVRVAVDRRFNRRRYDADQAMAAFGARIRDELDLSMAGRAVEELVASTLEPSHQRLWVVPTR